MARCPFCDLENPNSVRSCQRCGSDLYAEPQVRIPAVETPAVAAVPPSTFNLKQRPGGTDTDRPPPGAQPRLVVIRGRKLQVEHLLYEGENFIGRMGDKPVDIDLGDQESPERAWCSRQHAVIIYQGGRLAIEDLKSANGTFVNRTRLEVGKRYTLRDGDVIQIGNIHMKVMGP
jgi:hypothetical protein